MTDLLKLAERIEMATGPDRDIDGWITVALDPDRKTIVGAVPGRFPQEPIYGTISDIMAELGGKDGADYINAPAYTTSLDAAMTLAPAWCEVALMIADGCGYAGVGKTPGDCTVKAATLALALCAASLRARALSPDKGGDRG